MKETIQDEVNLRGNSKRVEGNLREERIFVHWSGPVEKGLGYVGKGVKLRGKTLSS